MNEILEMAIDGEPIPDCTRHVSVLYEPTEDVRRWASEWASEQAAGAHNSPAEINTPVPIVEEDDGVRHTVTDYREYFERHRQAIKA
jgi:hypothetical protein